MKWIIWCLVDSSKVIQIGVKCTVPVPNEVDNLVFGGQLKGDTNRVKCTVPVPNEVDNLVFGGPLKGDTNRVKCTVPVPNEVDNLVFGGQLKGTAIIGLILGRTPGS
jgi:hypothetical protein